MLKPLQDNVILIKEKKDSKTASGIILSESKEDAAYAVVAAVGPGIVVDGKLQPIDVKVGDKVVFKKYSTTEVKIDDKEYMVIASKDILAKIE